MGVIIDPDFQNLVTNVREDFLVQLAEGRALLKQIVQDAADYMRLIIRTTPTFWMEIHEGKSGRIDTGLMLSSVGAEFTGTNQWQFKATVGYTKGFENYFLWQEEGGMHAFGNPNANLIAPLYAFRDMNERLASELAAAERSLF